MNLSLSLSQLKNLIKNILKDLPAGCPWNSSTNSYFTSPARLKANANQITS